MKVSLVIPTLEEEEGIAATLADVDPEEYRRRGWGLEVIVVDGDSKDRTRERAEAAGARVVVERRRGYGRAYKTGFREATGDVVVTGDADGTYPLHDAPAYVERLLRDGLGFLTCDRYADLREGAMSPKHRFGNGVLSLTTRLLFRVPLRDSQSGMWVLRKSDLERIPVEALPDGMAFSEALKVEAFRALGPRAAEAPASLRPRIGEPVLSSWRDGLRNLWALWRRRLTGRWPGR